MVLLQLTFGLFRTCSQFQISFGLGPGSGLYFKVRTGLGPYLVGLFTTLKKIVVLKHHKSFKFYGDHKSQVLISEKKEKQKFSNFQNDLLDIFCDNSE